MNINSRLFIGPEIEPDRLRENDELSFQGSKIYGQGFLLTPKERSDLISRDPKNADRIFPYIGGKEVNTDPEQSFHRYVINFSGMDLGEAGRWPDLLDIVREMVKPERDKLNRNAIGLRRKRLWWRYGSEASDLYAAIDGLPRCLVTAKLTKHLCFSFQPTGRVFAESLYVFPFTAYTHFAVLQSRVYEPWVQLLSSTMRDAGIRYSNTDCFDNFPFPGSIEWI